MGAELGATCSVFPYTPRMGAYLRATGRAAIAAKSDAIAKQMLAVRIYICKACTAYIYTIQDSTAQHNTAQYSTTQRNTVQQTTYTQHTTHDALSTLLLTLQPGGRGCLLR